MALWFFGLRQAARSFEGVSPVFPRQASSMKLSPARRRRRQSSSQAPTRLRLEPLEDRRLLAVAPQLLTALPGPGPDITEMVEINGISYFSAYDNVHGKELWKSDGTAAGTAMVKDIYLGSVSSNPANLTDVEGTLFFTAYDDTHGTELWKSDGSEAGTVLVQDIYAGSDSSSPQHLLAVGDTLFLTAYEEDHGRELWKSDGATAGTEMIADIYAGSVSSDPQNLTEAGGIVFFSAYEATNGRELYQSDGSTAGTEMVADIYPGSVSSNPQDLQALCGTLFFTADDGTLGRQLWSIDWPVTAADDPGGGAANDGNGDSFVLSRVGDTLQITINGNALPARNIGDVVRITLAGSTDQDTFTVNSLGDFAGNVVINAAGEGDIVRLYDSPGSDELTAYPNSATFEMESGYTVTTNGQFQLFAYSQNGGEDRAYLHDLEGSDDTFKAWPTGAKLYGDGFFNQAKSFAQVFAYSGVDHGFDIAALYDDAAGNDTFQAWPTEARLYGNGFSNRVQSFAQVHAFSGPGHGQDVAQLYDDDSGDDTFKAWPDQAKLYGDGFYNRAKSFAEVYAYAEQGSGGADVGYLYDSTGDDYLEARDGDPSGEDWVMLRDEAMAQYAIWAYGLDGVWTDSGAGDDDTADEGDNLDFSLDLMGVWENQL